MTTPTPEAPTAPTSAESGRTLSCTQRGTTDPETAFPPDGQGHTQSLQVCRNNGDSEDKSAVLGRAKAVPGYLAPGEGTVWHEVPGQGPGKKDRCVGVVKPGANSQYFHDWEAMLWQVHSRALGRPGAWKPRLVHSPASLAWTLSPCTVLPGLTGAGGVPQWYSTCPAILTPGGGEFFGCRCL